MECQWQGAQGQCGREGMPQDLLRCLYEGTAIEDRVRDGTDLCPDHLREAIEIIRDEYYYLSQEVEEIQREVFRQESCGPYLVEVLAGCHEGREHVKGQQENLERWLNDVAGQRQKVSDRLEAQLTILDPNWRERDPEPEFARVGPQETAQ